MDLTDEAERIVEEMREKFGDEISAINIFAAFKEGENVGATGRCIGSAKDTLVALRCALGYTAIEMSKKGGTGKSPQDVYDRILNSLRADGPSTLKALMMPGKIFDKGNPDDPAMGSGSFLL
jgi:hypothetical protein